MEKTTVTVMNRYTYYPVSECMCDECGDIFVDSDDNYQYCPHCGRKIGQIVEDSRLHLGDSENG